VGSYQARASALTVAYSRAPRDVGFRQPGAAVPVILTTDEEGDV
jgi:hypothetical protein